MKSFKRLAIAAIAAMALMAAGAAATASATTIEINGVTQNKSVEITASLEPGTSFLIKDSGGTTADTCTELDMTFHTEAPYSTTKLGAVITKLGFTKCSHTTTVLNNGTFDIHHIAGTTDGLIIWTGGEVTIVSTAFGVSAVCKGGAGTTLGTLTGKASGNAAVDINAKVSCGILGTTTWTADWTITEPAGAGIED
ncbi:MAG TPA: hypothetical protein VFN18_12605 [Solirubrobacterales bacterium]|nr:hypothetical protein [Solirubrobacterales bacterium]